MLNSTKLPDEHSLQQCLGACKKPMQFMQQSPSSRTLAKGCFQWRARAPHSFNSLQCNEAPGVHDLHRCPHTHCSKGYAIYHQDRQSNNLHECALGGSNLAHGASRFTVFQQDHLRTPYSGSQILCCALPVHIL
eukprot:5303883-Amphidinium_carterae.1